MIVVVDDDPVTRLQLTLLIQQLAGVRPRVAKSAEEAVPLLRGSKVAIVDWQLPGRLGTELIEQARRQLPNGPRYILITSVTDPEAVDAALLCSPDGFLQKPISKDELALALTELGIVPGAASALGIAPTAPKKPLAQATTQQPVRPRRASSRKEVIVVASSTGGPQQVMDFVRELDAQRVTAPIAIVQHAPAWILDAFADRLKREAKRAVVIVHRSEEIRPNTIFLPAPDRHLVARYSGAKRCLEAIEGPMVNFVRPAADPLFISVSETFGAASVAVVLTGLGRDGASGALAIAERGGDVFVQQPKLCQAPPMPEATIELVPDAETGSSRELAVRVARLFQPAT